MSRMRDRIFDAMKTYYQMNKSMPTRVHLEPEDEIDLLKDLMDMPLETLNARLLVFGVRQSFERGGTLMGMTILWNCAQFKVDRPEDDKKNGITSL
jgi:hypothetical protein